MNFGVFGCFGRVLQHLNLARNKRYRTDTHNTSSTNKKSNLANRQQQRHISDKIAKRRSSVAKPGFRNGSVWFLRDDVWCGGWWEEGRCQSARLWWREVKGVGRLTEATKKKKKKGSTDKQQQQDFSAKIAKRSSSVAKLGFRNGSV